MSIYYSGTFKRSGGIVSAIGKHLKLMNLKPVKKIQVQFDPFHPNAVAARDFLHFISSPKITATNLSCTIRTNVVCDRSEPQINIELLDSKKIQLLSGNLTVLELLQIFNKYVSSTVKPDVVVTEISKKVQKKRR